MTPFAAGPRVCPRTPAVWSVQPAVQSLRIALLHMLSEQMPGHFPLTGIFYKDYHGRPAIGNKAKSHLDRTTTVPPIASSEVSVQHLAGQASYTWRRAPNDKRHQLLDKSQTRLGWRE